MSLLHSDFPTHTLPYESECKNAVKLNFNYWCHHSRANSAVCVADIVDLLASLCNTDCKLPIFLDDGVQYSIKHVVFCVVTGSIDETPFLSKCSSVPICFLNSPSSYQQSISSPHKKSSIDYNASLAISLLLWPPVPSLHFDQIPQNLFSHYRLVFRAFHTSWSDELIFRPDTSLQSKIEDEMSLFIGHIANSPNCVCGTFKAKSSNLSGVYITENITSLHLVFSANKGFGKVNCSEVGEEYVALDVVAPLEMDAFSENRSSLSYRSTKKSRKSDEILSLTLVEIKPTLYSTLWTSNNTQSQKELRGSLPRSLTSVFDTNEANSIACDFAHLREIYTECTSKYPGRLEDAVCSELALDMLGFNDTGRGDFIPTASWNIFNSNIAVDDLEDGEEVDDMGSEHNLIKIDNKLSICALDCEMCLTNIGFELTRVSVLCPINGVILDTLVKPDRPIVDYNFEYSGINEVMLSAVTVKRMDVLRALSSVIDSTTIIVGHSLSSDFNALGIIHKRVIDTAALYPHENGWPFKRSLKDLSLECLGKKIQDGDNGHDPTLDAFIAFELAMLFVMFPEDHRSRLLPSPWSSSSSIFEDRHTIFHHIRKAVPVPAPEGIIRLVNYSCKGYDVNMTENFCVGDGLESDMSKAHEAFIHDNSLSLEERSSFEFKRVRHEDIYSTLEALKSAMSTEQHDGTSIYLTHIPCRTHLPPRHSKEKETHVCSRDLDTVISDIYAASRENTMLLVVSQDDIGGVKKLLSKKQRCAWLESSRTPVSFINAQNDATACWTNNDEAELTNAILKAKTGMLYLKYKD